MTASTTDRQKKPVGPTCGGMITTEQANRTAPHRSQDAQRHYNLALDAQRKGDWQASFGHVQAAIGQDPQNPKYRTHAGAMLFMLHRHNEAADAYRAVLGLEPEHLTALNNLAVILSLNSQFQEAESLLQRSLARNPAQLEAWLNLCSAVEGLDYRENDQVGYARKAVALAPRNPRPYRYLAKALLRAGNPAAALETLRTAAALDPGNADIAYSIGICHVQLDQVAEAVKFFQQALVIDPKHGQTYYALGEFLYRLGELPAAEEAVRHALEFLPEKISPGKLQARILFAMGEHQAAKDSFVAARMLEYRLRKERVGIPVPDNKFVLASVESVEQWCGRNALPIKEILPEAVWQAHAPVLFGNAPADLPLPAARLPHAYIAEVTDAVVLPGHEVILADNDRIALYDRLVHMGDWFSLREDDAVPLIANDSLLAECGALDKKRVKAGIFLFSEGWYNYAHWLIEQLPRLYSVEQVKAYAGLPLLVNDGLYSQQMESLRLVSRGRFPIRILDSNHRHRVDRLIFPSNLVAYHKRRFRPGERATAVDGPFHPEAVEFLRDRLLPQCAPDAKPVRRLWLSRKRQAKIGQRRLINEAELEALFVAKGFESVFPETLTFEQQVRLFAEAEMIAGPGGAAMMNIVFAPPGAKTLIFTKDNPQVNFHYFTNIGQIIGHHVAHVCGEALQTFGVHGFETDFSVNLESAREAMHQFMGI